MRFLHRSVLLPAIIGVLATVALMSSGTGAGAAARIVKPWDFNGDGYRDVVIAAPYTTVAGIDDAGSMAILYSGPDGPASGRRQRVDKSMPWFPGDPLASDVFGRELTTGDFNGDGYADLAVCSNFGPTPDTSDIHLVFGSPTGLNRVVTHTLWDSWDCLDAGVYSADFNRNGYSDLVFPGARTPYVAYGNPDMDEPTVRWNIAELGDPSISVTSGAAGDVTGDGYPDLVVAGPKDQLTGRAALIYKGSANGISHGSQGSVVTENVTSVAIGDINRDGFGDTALGSGTSTVAGKVAAGRVQIVYGSATGFSTRKQTITQDTPGVPGGSEPSDNFGYDVAIGDINGDRYADLATGALTEDLGPVANMGMITTILGGPSGLNMAKVNAFSENTAGIPGVGEAHDLFGSGFLIRDLNADGRAEVVVAAAGDPAVFVMKGTASGPTPAGTLMFRPQNFGMTNGTSFARDLR